LERRLHDQCHPLLCEPSVARAAQWRAPGCRRVARRCIERIRVDWARRWIRRTYSANRRPIRHPRPRRAKVSGLLGAPHVTIEVAVAGLGRQARSSRRGCRPTALPGSGSSAERPSAGPVRRLFAKRWRSDAKSRTPDRRGSAGRDPCSSLNRDRRVSRHTTGSRRSDTACCSLPSSVRAAEPERRRRRGPSSGLRTTGRLPSVLAMVQNSAACPRKRRRLWSSR